MIVTHCDAGNHGVIVLLSFATKLQELAVETDSEVKLRRFAKQVSNASINLPS